MQSQTHHIRQQPKTAQTKQPPNSIPAKCNDGECFRAFVLNKNESKTNYFHSQPSSHNGVCSQSANRISCTLFRQFVMHSICTICTWMTVQWVCAVFLSAYVCVLALELLWVLRVLADFSACSVCSPAVNVGHIASWSFMRNMHIITGWHTPPYINIKQWHTRCALEKEMVSMYFSSYSS